MKFVYEYRTSDNVHHEDVIYAANREAAFSALKARGIRPAFVGEAPGFFNKLFGKGKRWMAIGVLCALCLVLCAVVYTQGARSDAQGSIDALIDSTVRRQLAGDIAIIGEGVMSGWSDVFAQKGDRELARYAIPGVDIQGGVIDVKAVADALAADEKTVATDGIEARQIKAIVRGMKNELREYVAQGGSIEKYALRLARRQAEELSVRSRIQDEFRRELQREPDTEELMAIWQEKNGELRQLGLPPIECPNIKNDRRKIFENTPLTSE